MRYYDVFKFDVLCFASKCLTTSNNESDSPLTSLELKPLPESLKYSFLRPNESLPVIIASKLDQD